MYTLCIKKANRNNTIVFWLTTLAVSVNASSFYLPPLSLDGVTCILKRPINSKDYNKKNPDDIYATHFRGVKKISAPP